MFPSELEEQLSIFREMGEEREKELDRFANVFVQNITEKQIEIWEKGLNLMEERVEKTRERFEALKKKFEEGEIGNHNSE